MNYIKVPGMKHRVAHDADVKELFGLDRKAKWPAEGVPERVIQGVRCRVDPITAGRFSIRARAVCPDCGKDMPIGRLAQHAKVHKDPRSFLMRGPLKTREEAEEFVRALHAAGLLFHFDDSPETIIDARTDARVFTDAEAARVRLRVAELFALLGDPFALAVALTNEGGA